MEILHLTDLHVTKPNTSLQNLWATAVPRLAGRKFQFIVVSGDLTQSAGEAEFDQLLKFSEGTLLGLLKVRDRRRIIFVPGNHDVDWSHRFGTPVKASKSKAAQDRLKSFLREPEKSDLRARVNDRTGTLDILSITDKKKYQQRFRRVSEFFESFYGKVSDPHRPFDLLSSDPTKHWSAHVFKDQKVAFYGFSSCFSNDAYWRGASLDEDAVRSAAEHANKFAPHMIRVAVWHHGLFSKRGDPDHLSPKEIGYVRFNDFHLGIHGHTHMEEFGDFRDILGDAFPIVATGSFGVGPDERPDARNQFAILDLSSHYLHIERFERIYATQWTSTKQLPYRLVRAERGSTRFNEAHLQHRVLEVEPFTGHTTVMVRFENLELHEELVLAEPVGPYSNIVRDEAAQADGSYLPIHERKIAPGRTRLSVAGTGKTYRRLSWKSIFSNILTRERAALQMRKWTPFGERLRNDPDWKERDWAAHSVTTHCKELRLEIRLKPEATGALFDGDVAMRVFATRHNAADTEEPLEAERCRIEAARDGRSVLARIERPILGYRYVLGYRPALAGVTYDSSATLMLIQNLADASRRSAPGPSLRTGLTDAIEERIRHVLGIRGEGQVIWYGYLWNHQERCLQVAFGNCPWIAATETFEYGRGVAGHAFRTRQPASYYSSEGKRSLIYLRQEGVEEPEWIVAIPILLSKDGPAVGVVGFSGTGSSEANRELRDFARRMATRESESGTRSGVTQDRATLVESRLFPAISMVFWSEIPNQIGLHLGSEDLVEAVRIYGEWNEAAGNPFGADRLVGGKHATSEPGSADDR